MQCHWGEGGWEPAWGHAHGPTLSPAGWESSQAEGHSGSPHPVKNLLGIQGLAFCTPAASGPCVSPERGSALWWGAGGCAPAGLTSTPRSGTGFGVIGTHRGLAGSRAHVGRDAWGCVCQWMQGTRGWYPLLCASPGGSWHSPGVQGDTRHPQSHVRPERQPIPIIIFISILIPAPSRSPAASRQHCISPEPNRAVPAVPPPPPPHLLGAELPVQVAGAVVPDEVVQRVPALRPLPA